MLDLITNIQRKGDIYYPNNVIEDKEIHFPETGYDILFDLEENSFWFQHRNKCILSLVKEFSPNELFVDIGGGNGFTSQFLKRNGIESILIEPGLNGALNASKRGVEAICATIEELQFKDESVKAIGLFDVVEHIEDDLNFMQQVHKTLASDGLVYITVPAYNFLWSDEDIHAGHFRRYTLKTMKELLYKSGFEITYSSYFFQALILPIFLLRSLTFKLGVKKELTKESSAKDHPKEGFTVSIINQFLKNELKQIQRLQQLSYGASLILVAKKSSN